MPEVYVSTDIEADGPIPGPHSMLSLGSAAYLADKTLVGTFSVNFELLEEASGHPDTMAWWSTQPEAWAAARTNPQDPRTAMASYVEWLLALPGTPVFVAYPATFDFTFVYWYLVRFTGSSPFGSAGLDIRTYAMSLLGRSWDESEKAGLPTEWFDDLPHTHIALDDALGHGALLCNMLTERARR